MSQVVFVDTETTGLDPERHEIWEVALIDGRDEEEYQWQLPCDLGTADAYALKLTEFYERRKTDDLAPLEAFAAEFRSLTSGCHMVGAVPSFDEERLRKLLRANGACPDWHYHLVDVENLAVGYLAAQGKVLEPPWDSEDLSRAVGVEPNEIDRHTALGDARWAKAIYERIMGAPPVDLQDATKGRNK